MISGRTNKCEGQQDKDYNIKSPLKALGQEGALGCALLLRGSYLCFDLTCVRHPHFVVLSGD
jgi:hypothetical protein